MEQLMADVESQTYIISSDDVSPVASYSVKSSTLGSRLEVIIEDGSTNSSQAAYDYRLCRNVEVQHITGGFQIKQLLFFEV